MIHWLTAAFIVIAFVIFLRLFGLVDKSREVINTSRRSLGVIRSASLTDDEKEAELQKNAKRLFHLFFMIISRGVVAAFLPLGCLWLCDKIELISLASTLDIAMSIPFLVGSCILVILVFWISSGKTQETSDYSFLDRVMHRVAFRTSVAQIALADMEDKIFSGKIAEGDVSRPVFITSLPRAGTTLLLECLAGSNQFASHCYEDMPFVLIPCLWRGFSGMFRKSKVSRERTHGDGMLINPASPEALEEVIWKVFWKNHYRKDRIILWDEEKNEEFEEFFRNHMKKIIFLRGGYDVKSMRYVSKNNLNIARISYLHHMFPDSFILVPFRCPLDHAASMMEQHRNFLRIHKLDSFASDYMRYIGHYDFGENLRPVDFGGWLDKKISDDAETLSFWMEYWVTCYHYLLENYSDLLHFVSYEDFCDKPEETLKIISEKVEISNPEKLISEAKKIRSPKKRDLGITDIPASLYERAEHLHTTLKTNAINSNGS